MNYYTLFSPNAWDEMDSHSIIFNGCCSIGEAFLEDFWGDPPEKRVYNNIIGGIDNNLLFLVWAVVPNVRGNEDCLDIISSLPNTVYVGTEKSKTTGNVVHMYVTNLVKEIK